MLILTFLVLGTPLQYGRDSFPSLVGWASCPTVRERLASASGLQAAMARRGSARTPTTDAPVQDARRGRARRPQDPRTRTALAHEGRVGAGPSNQTQTRQSRTARRAIPTLGHERRFAARGSHPSQYAPRDHSLTHPDDPPTAASPDSPCPSRWSRDNGRASCGPVSIRTLPFSPARKPLAVGIVAQDHFGFVIGDAGLQIALAVDLRRHVAAVDVRRGIVVSRVRLDTGAEMIRPSYVRPESARSRRYAI